MSGRDSGQRRLANVLEQMVSMKVFTADQVKQIRQKINDLSEAEKTLLFNLLGEYLSTEKIWSMESREAHMSHILRVTKLKEILKAVVADSQHRHWFYQVLSGVA